MTSTRERSPRVANVRARPASRRGFALRPVATVATVLAVAATLFLATFLATSGGRGYRELAMAIGGLATIGAGICLAIHVAFKEVAGHDDSGRRRR